MNPYTSEERSFPLNGAPKSGARTQKLNTPARTIRRPMIITTIPVPDPRPMPHHAMPRPAITRIALPQKLAMNFANAIGYLYRVMVKVYHARYVGKRLQCILRYMQITSPAFENGERIPAKYTCEGDRLLSPELAINDVPEAAQTLALIMDDPDVPKALRPDGNFTHWVLFNILPETALIPEGGTLGTPGVNGTGDTGYRGPCPPPDYEPKTHRYLFKLYALDTRLDLPEGATKEDVEAAMEDRILATAELVGTYSRD